MLIENVYVNKSIIMLQTRAKIERTVKAIAQRCGPGDVEDDRREHYSRMDLHAFKTVAEHFRTTCFDWHKEEVNNTINIHSNYIMIT